MLCHCRLLTSALRSVSCLAYQSQHRKMYSSQNLTYSVWSKKIKSLKETPRKRFNTDSTLMMAPQASSTSQRQELSTEPEEWRQPFHLPEPELDWDFLLNPENADMIYKNISNRKGIGDIYKVLNLSKELKKEQDESKKESLRQLLVSEALDIPNFSHPDTVIGDESQAKVVEIVGKMKELKFPPRNVSDLAGRGLRMLRDENLTFSTGAKTYYLEDKLAKLERALVAYTIDRLLEKGFELVSVPDLLFPGVIDSCGFKTNSGRSQVYQLHEKCLQGACLAGTAEMSLAGYFMNETLAMNELPKRMMAVSRCYRAEAAERAIEKGLYRVHHFTKVEMFGLTAHEDGKENEQLLQEILSIEKELFSDLGLYFRILDMPTQELGAPAHRKYDIETWMYGKKMWGEISSCSSCTDYQARRLNIKYMSPSTGQLKHVHTVNGTACAVPRMITSILEQNQEKGRKLPLPQVLWPYMDGEKEFNADMKKSWFTFIKSLRQDA
ncbi:serine--tRNA ligase mitochondrial [Biomphalaria pfeifferi]|uniref:serine--tRNA ligase n=1 Tax=Biomphalaria pfeifferi TaxID=112525 RepID=A0AAD8BQ74_BIOPF|nr:serine--tRNA ligase mitochondrial [Biomphalaria pfeifferi]